MTAPHLLCEDVGAVRILTLNRPRCRNALDTALCETLLDALETANLASSIGAVVLTGAGDHFCAGADTREFPSSLGPQADRFRQRTALLAGLQQRLDTMEKPIVAAVDGAAVGAGASLALCCDLIVASDNLRFGFPELKKGILPAMVLASLHRALPRQRAFELIALADLIDAEAADRYGLLARRVTGPARATALEIATSLSETDRTLMRRAKSLFAETRAMGFDEALAAGVYATLQARGLKASDPA